MVPAKHRHGCWGLSLQWCKRALEAPARDYILHVRQAGGCCHACRWALTACCTCHMLPGQARSSGGMAPAAFKIEDVSVGQRRLCTPRLAMDAGANTCQDCSVSPGGNRALHAVLNIQLVQDCSGMLRGACWSSFAGDLSHLAHSSRSPPTRMLTSCTLTPDHRQPAHLWSVHAMLPGVTGDPALLVGDSSDLACGVDPKVDVRTHKVLHCANSKVQPVPGGLLNWPALIPAQ